MTEDKRKCEYRYKAVDRKCPRDALPGSKFCFWHEVREGKDLHNQHLEANEDLSEAYLDRANLQGAPLSSANLQGASLLMANLQGAGLGHANLQGAHLGSADGAGDAANLQGAHLWGANLQGAFLQYANLQRAELWDANLQGAHLNSANLREAVLHRANLHGADLLDADLHGADFRVAEISGARNLRYAKLDDIIISERLAQTERDIHSAFMYYCETADAYIDLKNYFREDGLYDLSCKYYIREGVVTGKIRRIASKANREERLYDDILLRFFPFSFKYKDRKFFPILLFLESKAGWIFNRFLDHTSKYGESPFRVILTSLIIIFIYSILYWLFSGITIGCLNFHPSFLESLNYSIATFTTFRYGDYHAKPSFQLVATSEAFIGVFMIAFFVVVVSRKIIR